MALAVPALRQPCGWWPRPRLGEQFGVGLQLATGHVLERSTDVCVEVLCPDGVPADGSFTSVMFQPGMVSVLTSCMVVLSSLWGTIDPEQYRASAKVVVAGRGRG